MMLTFLSQPSGRRRLSAPSAIALCLLLPGLTVARSQTQSPPPALNESFRLTSLARDGGLHLEGAFSNGVCTVLRAEDPALPWRPIQNIFTTSTSARVSLVITGAAGFYRAQALNLDGGRPGFTNLTLAYGELSTLAGAGGIQDVNNWRPEFEGAPATGVRLSGPHMAMADGEGNVYIADKDAHGIRKVRTDGTVVTVAGVNAPGNGPDTLTPGTTVALIEPNGLWAREDGVVYILDLGNGKVRRLDTQGMMRTLFQVPGGIVVGRGLWVRDDESRAFVASLTVVKEWTPEGGIRDFASGFVQLGNLVVDPGGRLVVTDRGTHAVYRLDEDGNRTIIAGNGSTVGGGDGQLATATALNEVRAVWFLPNGAFFVATHRGSQVWYVDLEGRIHLFLHGDRNGAHAGDGTWFYNPAQPRVSECRAITMDSSGNLLITENDIGYIRKVRFLPLDSAGL